MTSHTTERFRQLLAGLPKEIQKHAKEAYAQFQKTLIIQDYTSNGFILPGRFILLVFQKTIVSGDTAEQWNNLVLGWLSFGL